MKDTTMHEQLAWSSGGVVIAPTASTVDLFDDNLINRKPPM